MRKLLAIIALPPYLALYVISWLLDVVAEGVGWLSYHSYAVFEWADWSPKAQ